MAIHTTKLPSTAEAEFVKPHAKVSNTVSPDQNVADRLMPNA